MKRIIVTRSTVLDAPIARVWDVLRDFNGHDSWHPAVAESRIEDGLPPDMVGCVRQFRLASGAVLREQLLSLSDRDHSFTYCILDSPIPLIGYVATVALRPVTDGDRTFWHWQGRFGAPPGQEEALARLVGEQVYEAGMGAIRTRLRAGPVAPAIRTGQLGAAHSEGIVVAKHGGPEVLAWGRTPLPAPGAGEVRLRHTAIGLNFIDVYCRTGYFDLMRLPGTPGLEAAGVIEAVGEGVAGFAPGDRVAYACPPTGAYALARTMDARLLVPLPDDITEEVAAASLLKGMTAEFLLSRVHQVRAGDWVLVHAAAGGVGSFLAPWAASLGARVIGSAGSAEKARIALRRNACAHAVLLSDADWPEQVLSLTGGEGVSVAYDAIGRPTFEGSLRALAVRGHLVSYGQAGGDLGAVEIGRLAEKSITLSRPNYGHYMGTAGDVRRAAAALFDLLRRRVLDGTPTQRFALRDAAAAHRALESRATTGASILVP